jgi:F0F1-type ATP synthase assembly protein I
VLQVDWKDWGWCNAKVIKHDALSGKTEAEHMMERKKFTTDQLRLHPKQANPPSTTEEKSEARIKAMLMRVALLAGGVGMALGWLLPHFLPWLPR